MKKVLFAALWLALIVGVTEIGLRVADPYLHVASEIDVLLSPPVEDRAGPFAPLSPEPDSCDEPLRIRPPDLTLRRLGESPDRPERLMKTAPPHGERRVFVVGGSAAFGDGVEYDDTFTAELQARLGRPWRAVNAAFNGADSRAVMHAVKRIVDCHAPAAIIIMSGNNEWLHWRYETGIPWFYRWHGRLAASVAYRYLVAGSRWVDRARRHAAADRGVARFDPTHGCDPRDLYTTPGAFDVDAWRAQRRNYLTAFAFNLAQAVAYARERGVDVVLCTVPYRRNLCPAYFVRQPISLATDDATSAARLAAGLAKLDEGDVAGALSELEAGLVGGSGAPLADYFAGTAAARLGRTHEAAMHFRRAREQMVGNLGAAQSINGVIRELAAKYETPPADLDAAFLNARTDELEADALFHDFCHPTAAGHALIAATVYSALGFVNKP